MPRRSASSSTQALALPAQKNAAIAFARALKQVLNFALAIALVVGGVWAYFTVDHFLVSDPHLFLPGPPEPGQRSDSFRVEGAHNVSDDQVIRIFANDFGRSIYLCPLKARRLKLLGIDWVKDASIYRLWPNRLVVRLTERAPVAFAQMKGADGAISLSLVDADGVLLDPQRARTYPLPVITGLSRAEGEASRRERMKRFLRMQGELGTQMEKLSEINVGELDNLKVVQQFDGRAIILMLGNQSYGARYENFLKNQHEIRNRLPDALMLDLRLTDRITAVAVPVPQPQPAGAQK